MTALALLLLSAALPASAERWPQSPTITAYSEGAAAPYDPSGGVWTETARCGEGAATYLECRTTRAKTPQHDVDLGKTTLILRSRDGRELLTETVTELWECLSFDARTHRYVLVSKNEHGTKVTLRALVYLDEEKRTFSDSVFDAESFEAAAAHVLSGACLDDSARPSPPRKKVYFAAATLRPHANIAFA